MYLHVKESLLVQVTKARTWRRQYFVPDLDKNGELVPLTSKSRIRLTTEFNAIRGVLTTAAPDLTFHGAAPNETNEKHVYCRMQCPCGRTETPRSVKLTDDDEGPPESQPKGKTKVKGAGSRINHRTKTQRGTECKSCLNAIWTDDITWEQQLIRMQQGGKRQVAFFLQLY